MPWRSQYTQRQHYGPVPGGQECDHNEWWAGSSMIYIAGQVRFSYTTPTPNVNVIMIILGWKCCLSVSWSWQSIIRVHGRMFGNMTGVLCRQGSMTGSLSKFCIWLLRFWRKGLLFIHSLTHSSDLLWFVNNWSETIIGPGHIQVSSTD